MSKSQLHSYIPRNVITALGIILVLNRLTYPLSVNLILVKTCELVNRYTSYVEIDLLIILAQITRVLFILQVIQDHPL